MKVPYLGFDYQFMEEYRDLEPLIRGVFERGQFIMGPEVLEFEKNFAEFVGVKHAISVANGTDSLVLGLLALGIGPGDEVITPPNSWVSSASCIALVGARAVFCDVAADFNLDIGLLEKRITKKTKAIIAVHLTGKMARMPEIQYIASKWGIPVIEDAAQSVGAKIGTQGAGSMGAFGSFSLHPLKNLNAAGDAGIITTNSNALAMDLKMRRQHGMESRETIGFWGYNSRLDTLQAVILNYRLKKLPSIISRRREIADIYTKNLHDVVSCPVPRADEFHTYHTYIVKCQNRDGLIDWLNECGIETKIHYPTPIHLQPAAKDLGHAIGDFPVAEAQAKKILSLPINQYLTNMQAQYVCEKIKEFYA